MRIQKVLGVLAMVCMALLLAGCTGEGSFIETSGAGGGSGGDDSGTPVTAVPRMGILDGGVFSQGQISVGLSPLSAGGNSGLRVNIVDIANNNTPITDPVTVTFSSPCASGTSPALAAIEPRVVTTDTGTARADYRAQGCTGTETITATATINGTVLSAAGSITVQPSSLGAIQFVSAVPDNIGLRGSGRQETSAVTFTLRNEAGGPVQNQRVNFSLNTIVGGITLSPLEGFTNEQGQVQTTVRSGTVATVVRVTAMATGSGGVTISSQSSALTITTGIPDQDSFSLSSDVLNVEGFDVDGSKIIVTVRLADRFNNPVPDDTAVTFTTEGGSIQGSCLTAGGACSVEWSSQDPRPIDGRSTIRATAIGEESFIDDNGNGFYDTGESFTDLGEAFTDENENGIRDNGEPFLDFNNNSQFEAQGGGTFTGSLCNGVDCDSVRSLHVRRNLVVIMSGSTPLFEPTDFVVTSPTAFMFVPPDPADPDGEGFLDVLVNSSYRLQVFVLDGRDQPMPKGTIVSVASADAGAIEGSDNFLVESTSDASRLNNRFVFNVKTPEDPATGILEVIVTVPGKQPTVIPIRVRISV